jgi:hypothetical protein
VGRWDWWKLRKEHTPFQWAVQLAMYRVAPYGERRADMRAAVCAANLMAMQAAEQIDDEEFSKVVRCLTSYLPSAEDYEDIEDLEALKKLREQKGS